MRTRAIVARNALAMLVAQVITNVLSYVTVPLLARTLGSSAYGTWWLAGQVVGLGFLFVDWGQEGYIGLAVARDRARAPELLATTSVLRLAMGLALLPALEVVTRLLGYDELTRTVVRLFWVASLAAALATGAISVFRGVERMDQLAAARVAGEAARTVTIVGGVWLGARLRGLAALEIAAAALEVSVCVVLLNRLRLRIARPSWSAARELMRGGGPFLLWGGMLAIQPGLEAVLLSKLGSPDATGWYAATNKLVGLLLVPATLLMGAATPTLARLHLSDASRFRSAVRESLRAAMLLGAPVAVGAFIFAEPAMTIVYGARSFAPAAANLRVMSAYIALVFANITLGTAILASGRQMAWALVKGLTVAFTAAASFLVIPWFQAHQGNGGLGAAAMTVASEAGMLVVALALTPRGVIDRALAGALVRTLGAAAAMTGAAHLLSTAPLALSLLTSLLVYVAVLVVSGAVGKEDLTLLREVLQAARRNRSLPSATPPTTPGGDWS